MIGLIFLIFSVVSCELQPYPIPNYEGARDARENPKYREAFAKRFPHISLEAEIERQGRIVGGQPAILGQFPYQVLMYMTADGASWYICGGVLVKRNFILTAAHCIEEYNRIDIYVGLVDRPPGFYHWGTTITGRSNFIVHPDRNADDFSNDIGVLRMDEAPDNLLSSAYVDVVTLPNSSQMEIDLTGAIGTISGFGRVNNSVTSLSPRLLWAEAPIMDNAECAISYGPFVRRTNLCIDTRGGTSTCGGDSGGPLTVNGPLGEGPVLAGIVSFGSAFSCTSGYPTVFARVTHFVDWILSVITTNPPNPPPGEGGTCNCICNCNTCPALTDPELQAIDNFWRK
jgi:secreted trypsin-like serine protease